jgi:hypothetical protein
VASKVNLTVKDLIVFNFGTDRPAEINWYLNHYVGCPETPDKRNRMFSSSAKPGYIYYPTIRITIQPDTIITGDPRKSKARVLVQQFAANPSTGVWPYLARCQVAQQLMARIEAPYLINQGNAGLCPSAGVVYALASSRPDEYVKTVIDLYDMGRTQINNWKIEPTSDLKKYWVPGSTPAADWIILASIRDSENLVH